MTRLVESKGHMAVFAVGIVIALLGGYGIYLNVTGQAKAEMSFPNAKKPSVITSFQMNLNPELGPPPRAHGATFNGRNPVALVVTKGEEELWVYSRDGTRVNRVILQNSVVGKDITYHSGYYWLTDRGSKPNDISDDRVRKYGESGNQVSSFKPPASNPKGIAYVGSAHGGPYLWLYCDGSDKFYKVRTDGSVMKSFGNPTPFHSGVVEGIDVRFEGGTEYLYVTSDDDGDPAEIGGDRCSWMAKVNMDTLTTEKVYDMPGWDGEGVAFNDRGNVWHNDEYQNTFWLLRIEGAAPPEKGTIVVGSDPSGAVVHIGGQKVGSTPLSVQKKPGTYTVRAEYNGQSKSKTVDLQSGETEKLTFQFKPKGPSLKEMLSRYGIPLLIVGLVIAGIAYEDSKGGT